MFKYLIPLLVLISPPLIYAGDIFDYGLTISQGSRLEEPLGVVYATNDWRNGKYIVRIKLTQGNWEYQNRYIFEKDPSDEHIYIDAVNRVTNEFQKLPVRIPPVKYPNNYKQPIDSGLNITQDFGKTEFSKYHTGIDLKTNNSNVYSIYSGKIIYAGWDKFSNRCNNGGNMIKIQHDNGLYSVYMHLKKFLVKEGSSVKQGQVIAISGNTGKQNCKPLGNHLHFEVRTSAHQKDVINPRYIFDI